MNRTHAGDSQTGKSLEDGALHIRFIDDTKLWLGSASRATLDSFVFGPNSGPGEMVAAATMAVGSPIAAILTQE